jgi:hypothetical protein
MPFTFVGIDGVYVLMCTYMFACMYTCMCYVHVHVKVTGIDLLGVYPSHSPPYFWIHDSSLNLLLIDSAQLTCQQAPGILSLLSPSFEHIRDNPKVQVGFDLSKSPGEFLLSLTWVPGTTAFVLAIFNFFLTLLPNTWVGCTPVLASPMQT